MSVVRTKLLVSALAMVFVLSFMGAGSAVAAPPNDCPKSFQLHQVGDPAHYGGHGDSQHKHVGNDKDLNGDGYICGKHVGKDGTVHVHIDNNIPSDDE